MAERRSLRKRAYPSDLTDEQWAALEPLVPPARPGGRPRQVDPREVLNAVFYLERTGCQWAFLPHDFPPRSTVHEYYARWRRDGTWQRMLDALREGVRRQAGREGSPSLAAIDSQSVKTTEVGGERGYDGGKKVKGRKRHVVVDGMGLLLAVAVTAANVDDGKAAPLVLAKLRPEDYPRLEVVLGDGKYRSHALARWVGRRGVGYRVEVRGRPDGAEGFVPIKGRWKVERTLAWLGRYRRLSKDYEYYRESAEGHVLASAVHLAVRKLRPGHKAQTPPFKYPKKPKPEVAAA